LHESYRPNAFARILNDNGEVVRIVNNYEHISFNIGPTLMSWLERHDLETYQRILEADRRSCDRHQGHGNAIAQVYNHIILPLANHRDKVTQVRWGIADFQRRFGRDPEGMWLAETAVDSDTLKVLIAEGIRFIVLAPSQAARVRRFNRPDGYDNWQEVGNGEIDPTRPYRCFLPTQPNGRNAIDIFFYDGPISADMGFDDILRSSQHFAGRLAQAVRPDEGYGDPHASADLETRSQLISVATDGETFGHHRAGAEKALAYALVYEFPARGWQVTSYAHYLSLCPPTWEVQLKPVTAWSCSHGVDRWQRDCGCGGGGGWQQQWRKPLREALDTLRDRLAIIYEKVGAALLKDPWQARNDYISLLGDRSAYALNQFFAGQQTHQLTSAERTEALRLLEMQRHALLMYTSCGWFFDEISRPEGTQILRYAARAIELAEAVSGISLEAEFIGQLEKAPSNIAHFQNGAGVYLQQVHPHQISLEQVAAHYAMGSLFNQYRKQHQLYCYTLNRQDYYQQPLGALTLAVGQVEVISAMTQEAVTLAFAVVHLGGWDFHCGIRAFPSRAAYGKAKSAVIEAFASTSIAQSVLAITQYFSPTYTLQGLFAEERQQIMQQLTQENLQRLDQLYEQVYRENYGVLMAFHRDHIAVPQALQVAADITLSHRALEIIRSLEQEIAEPDGNLLKITIGRIAELEGIATEAHHFRCTLKLPGARPILERLIWQGLHQTLPVAVDSSPHDLASAIEGLERLIALGNQLGLPLALYRVQELYYAYLMRSHPSQATAQQHWALWVQLGHALAMDVEAIWTHS
jgi:alpha-amylase/alpha-mannosidase (GH57 family)